MKDSVVIKINKREFKVTQDQTVLTVAKNEGIDIPTFCYFEGIDPYGACRLCMVEVIKGPYRPGITTSCTLKVKEGLEILTDTEEIRKYRKILLRLYLVMAPDSDAVKNLALKYGVTSSPFSKKIDLKDPLKNRCILCGLCVRVCDVLGVGAINYIGRGVYTKINTPYLEQSQDCLGCGACAKICPTGAIKFEDIEKKRIMTSWIKTEIPFKECSLCGKDFVTEAFSNFVYAKLHIEVEDDLKNLCYDCRRKISSRKATRSIY